ncbi:MAG: dihydropteroate synthase [Firmicutes bacterium]|nr:dihydropteroate synthase [Bacillota bacterium]
MSTTSVGRHLPFGIQSLPNLSESNGWVWCHAAGAISLHQVVVMGILNVTPDSFSDGGNFVDVDAAVTRALEMDAEGAAIIDIGGESTRPGYQPVSAEEELRRVLPVLEALQGRVQAALSIDTSKAEVAREALRRGAVIVNDQWGLKRDPKMARLIGGHGAGVVLMHNRTDRHYRDFWPNLLADLEASLFLARQAGIDETQIVLDPGIGFAKSLQQNLAVAARVDRVAALGYPVLVGPSRKSFIGRTLDLPVQEREEGTAAAVACAVLYGARIVRVHDVKAMVRVARMAEALREAASVEQPQA